MLLEGTRKEPDPAHRNQRKESTLKGDLVGEVRGGRRRLRPGLRAPPTQRAPSLPSFHNPGSPHPEAGVASATPTPRDLVQPPLTPCHRPPPDLLCRPPDPLTRRHAVATRLPHSLHQNPVLRMQEPGWTCGIGHLPIPGPLHQLPPTILASTHRSSPHPYWPPGRPLARLTWGQLPSGQ